MWSLGWQETVFIFLLALLIFGPKKLPELGKTLAKGLGEFRRASSELKSTFDREMATIEKETGSIKEDLNKNLNEFTNYDSYYENNYYDSGYDGYSSSESSTQENSTVSASATQGAESSTQPGELPAGGTTPALEAANTTEVMVAEPVAKAEAEIDGAAMEGKPVART